MASIGWLVLGSVTALSLPAVAAPAPQPNTVSELVVPAMKMVEELTITAKLKCLQPDRTPERAERPRVVSTFPARGAVVRPGIVAVRVTFDQPMACSGLFTAASPLPNPCPGPPRDMLLSFDRRTVRTLCVVEPDAQYGFWVSQDPTANSFMGMAGLPSTGYRLSFTTSAEAPITTVCDALVEDELTARQIRARRPLDCSQQPGASGN
jgi:hypothetical protein